jgi:O-antigen ligase
LACKKKHSYIHLIVATLLLIGLFLSCSRGSIVGGVLIYIVCFIVTFIKAENKKCFRISSGALVGVALIFLIVFNQAILELFSKVPSIIKDTQDNSLAFNDSSRFKIYEYGLQTFLQNPIFGQSFYPYHYVPYGFSTVESFSSFFPPRWHNTIIQILASCGIVGMIAYAYHRYQTIKLFVKKPTKEKSYIAFSIIALLVMSMLDCHFFNVGPVLFYSMALAFAENINSTNDIKEN